MTVITIRRSKPWDNSWLSPLKTQTRSLACSRVWVVCLGQLGGVFTQLLSSWAATSWTDCKSSENQEELKNTRSFCLCTSCQSAHTVVWLCGYLRLFLSHFPKDRIPVMKTKACVSPLIQGSQSRFPHTFIQVEIGSNSVEVARFNSAGLALGRLVCHVFNSYPEERGYHIAIWGNELSKKTADRRRWSFTLIKVMLVEMKDRSVPPFSGQGGGKGQHFDGCNWQIRDPQPFRPAPCTSGVSWQFMAESLPLWNTLHNVITIMVYIFQFSRYAINWPTMLHLLWNVIISKIAMQKWVESGAPVFLLQF